MYSGAGGCQISGCKYKAYFSSRGKCVCGRHSKADAERSKLKKDPKKKENRELLLLTLDIAAHQAYLDNCKAKREGKLSSSKLKMMKAKPYKEGFFAIFPNIHATATKGIEFIMALPELSPMSLGPVNHLMENVPPANTIEQFHQYSKVFPSEADSRGNPLPIWYERREKGFTSNTPQRHKLGKTKAEHIKNAGGVNFPLYSLYEDPKLGNLRLQYVDSRVLYCTFYERLVTKTREYKTLEFMLNHGANLNIIGHDSRDLDSKDITEANIKKWYSDTSVPFGHEAVLLTLLYLRDTPEKYPWRIAREKLGITI